MLKVCDIMTSDPAVVGPDEDRRVAHGIMIMAAAHHVPVVRDGVLEGIVSERDLLALQLDGMGARVKDIMTRNVRVAHPRDSVDGAAARMLSHRISCLPVVDGRRLIGIVTAADMVALAAERIFATTGSLPVAELMTPLPLVTVRAVDEVPFAHVMLRFGHFRHLPVLEAGRLVGLLSDRDVLAAAHTRLDPLSPAQALDEVKLSVAEIMTPNPETVTPDADAAWAGRLMLARQLSALPVLRAERLVGMLTRTDFLRYLMRATLTSSCLSYTA